MDSYSIAEARDQFTSLLRSVQEHQQPVEVTKHGKPVAVVISIREYIKFRDGKKDFWEELQEFSKDIDPKNLLTSEDLQDLRDSSTGRNVDL